MLFYYLWEAVRHSGRALVDLARLFWFDVFWLWPGTPAALRGSAGWSISWLMTQQMFAAQPVKRFPFSWPPCQECARTDGKTRTRSSSIITKSYSGKQFQRAPSVLTAFLTTSPSPQLCDHSWLFKYLISLPSSRRQDHNEDLWGNMRR